jgi:hypothetical protein
VYKRKYIAFENLQHIRERAPPVKEFLPDPFGDRHGRTLLANEVESVNQRQIEGGDVSETTSLSTGIVELLVEFLARVVAVDLALAQQSVEIAVREPGKFACFSERENPLSIEREGQFPSQNVVPLVLGDVQRIVNVGRDVDRPHRQ